MTRWGGDRVMRLRAEFAVRLPLPCARCGLPVQPDHRWHLGHRVDRALGGSDELTNLWPEHGRCNESAGAKLGHQLAGHQPRRRTGPAPPAVAPVVDRRRW